MYILCQLQNVHMCFISLLLLLLLLYHIISGPVESMLYNIFYYVK